MENTKKARSKVVAISAEKAEIARLKGELQAAHSAYLSQVDRLVVIRDDIHKLSVQQAAENKKLTATIESLQQELLKATG